MMIFGIFLVLLVFIGDCSASRYVRYDEGNMPLIITAPHGGSRTHPDIPERSVDTDAKNNKKYCGFSLRNGRCVYDHAYDRANACDGDKCKVSFYKDMYTDVISQGLVNEIQTLKGQRPYYVKMEVRRNQIDANRDKDIATFGNPDAEYIYDLYAQKINTAKDSLQGARGLLLDIHGHSHSHEQVELGYGIYSSKWSCPVFTNSCFKWQELTVRSLLTFKCPTIRNSCIEKILRGTESLGYFLQRKGQKVMPSPRTPSPAGMDYFSGGYTVKTFGSRDGGIIDAIQVEIPREIRYSLSKRLKFIKDLAAAVLDFMEENGYL